LVPPEASRPRSSQGRDLFLPHISSQLDLLRDAKRIIDLDAKGADGAFELSMPEEKLHARRLPVFLYIWAAFVRRIECVPQAELSSPSLSTQAWTIRAYCRVERCSGVRKRLGKRYCPFLASISGSQARIEVRVCSVISN